MRLAALRNMLKLAREHVREVGGNNRGGTVDKIIAYAHGALGEAWCVDGVIWAYGHAGSKIVKPGFTRAVRYMNGAGVRVVRWFPRPGHIVRYTFDHTGLLVGFRRRVRGRWVRCPRQLATHIMTVECNTSSTGAVGSDINDGTDGCYVKVRDKRLVRDYLWAPR